MDRIHAGNGRRPLSMRHPIEEAAAVRWFLTRSHSPEASPHELLEYPAAGEVLNQLEARYPGLRSFVEHVTAMARMAAGLKLAKASGVPTDVIDVFDRAVRDGWSGLESSFEQIICDERDRLLASYAQIADLAGVLAP